MEIQNKQDIFVDTNVLDAAKELQLRISEQPFDIKEIEANLAVDILGPRREYYGVREVLLHALSAYTVIRCLDRADVETVNHDELIVKGNFSGIAYLENNLAISSLCVALRASTIISKKMPNGKFENSRKRVDDELLVPVFAVEGMWPAA